jgi:serine/threonine protein kinase
LPTNSKGPKEDQKGILLNPNQFARPSSIDESNGLVTVHGYQEFVLTKYSVLALDNDENLKNKYNVVKSYFSPHYLKGKRVLDLGANGGFFSFLAAQNGAEDVTALDMDSEYVKIVKQAAKILGFQNINVINSNFSDWDRPAAVVLALALVHWVYSCTACFGSLDAVIKKLADLTDYMLIIEWVDPNDQAIEFFHHTQWNQEKILGHYNFTAFEEALSKYFIHHELLGDISTTRRVFAAYKTRRVLDFSCPFPYLYPREQLISSRMISFDPSIGIDLWSCVYRLENRICKQASLDLAEREAHFLQRLQGSIYFPHLLEGAKNYGEYSTVYMEDIAGRPILDVASSLTGSPLHFHSFILHTLNLCEELEKNGIVHRDIQADNVLIRNEKPVLIDFGWAISSEYPYMTPPGLSMQKTPPDGSFSNIYQMGLILDKISNHSHFYFDYVISRMIDPDASTRIEDIGILRRLFDLIYLKYYPQSSGRIQMNDSIDNSEKDASILLRALNAKTNEISVLVNEKKELHSQVERLNLTIQGYVSRLTSLEEKVMELNSILETREQKINKLEGMLADLHLTLKGRDEEIKDLDRIVKQSAADLEQAKQEILKYALSRSWQITRPVRKIFGFFKRGK